MPKKGKRNDTPEELDYLFDRDIISEDMYRDFWNNWWRSSPSEREEMIQFYSFMNIAQKLRDKLT